MTMLVNKWVAATDRMATGEGSGEVVPGPLSAICQEHYCVQ